MASESTVRISVRLKPTLHDKLVKHLDSKGLKQNNFITDLIEKALASSTTLEDRVKALEKRISELESWRDGQTD